MKVNNIFTSIQGEGLFQGFPTLFLRLFGCNLKCDYCDAKEAVFGNNFYNEKIENIAIKINAFQAKHICITGGEPLVQEKELVELLKKVDVSKIISIETNGSLSIKTVANLFPNVYFSVDWKTPASKNAVFCLENLDLISKRQGWIKFVVSDVEDLEFVKSKLQLLKEKNISVFVSPVFENGKNWFLETEKFCLENNLRFQLQIHKIIGVE